MVSTGGVCHCVYICKHSYYEMNQNLRVFLGFSSGALKHTSKRLQIYCLISSPISLENFPGKVLSGRSGGILLQSKAYCLSIYPQAQTQSSGARIFLQKYYPSGITDSSVYQKSVFRHGKKKPRPMMLIY